MITLYDTISERMRSVNLILTEELQTNEHNVSSKESEIALEL